MFVAVVRPRRPPSAEAPAGLEWATPYYGALVTRVSQVMAGELTLDDAFARIDEDIAAKVKDAAQQPGRK